MPPWAIYQQHLNNLHHGLPLWDPTPKKSLEIVEGSVLYPGIDGTFSVLFNTRKGWNDTHWQPHGVPLDFKPLDEEYSPLVIDGPRTVFGLRGWNCRSVECEREVSAGVRAGAKSSGAVLALDHHPKTTYIESSAHIASYMSRYHASWLEMANSQSPSGLGLGLNLEELYFVSGTTKVPQWFIGVFEGEEESEREGHLECTVSDVFDLTVQSSEVHTLRRSPILKKGPLEVPAETELPWDQCIFIHYYRMKRRRLRVPKVIRAAAGPHELPAGEPERELPAVLAADDDDSDMGAYIEQEPGRSRVSLIAHLSAFGFEISFTHPDSGSCG
ncbi:hypothetical protein OH76DRAFT_1335776 [Lentinus brumalis]|uniref:Uncharacterized protein n=1 Tax=Lentinus brumalis TaxID=2498619 RepID=A0A371DWY3_9APHY|nr:hypothetical protein OH76DRAFT_1335776 [Polyporus brumalis]